MLRRATTELVAAQNTMGWRPTKLINEDRSHVGIDGDSRLGFRSGGSSEGGEPSTLRPCGLMDHSLG